MGVLDDAIREHIELQRKHGANASELDRQEQEALGSARREAPAQTAEGEDADADVVELHASHADEPVDAPEPLEAVPEPVSEVDEPPPAPATPDIPEFVTPEPDSEVDEPPSEVDEPLPLEPAETEDVLEETPEFLQETPEHDRLWFEQKPPRDFDFDEDDR